MQTFRYDTSGNWYKGNCHIHSTASDGGMAFDEIAALYAPAGYDFLFRTDHWVNSLVAADTEGSPLLWLDGIELDGPDQTGAAYHVVCLGRVAGLTREMGLEAAMAAAEAQGAIVVLAHPFWCGNSTADALRHRFAGVEVYNHVCHWLNGKGEALAHWNAVLERNPCALALAVDDAHLRDEHPGWNGGWICVNAPELSETSVLASVAAGNFYASRGPALTSLVAEDDAVRATMSPVRFARLVGPGWQGQRLGTFSGPLITEAEFTIPESWSYAYLEIEDDSGRRAWTNSLFVSTG